MGILAPWFLAGIAAVGLPIWLHFLRRQRTDPRPFSSLMFFERRTETSVQPKRLRYLLLLALRMAALVLLALAFANPFITRTTLSSTRKKLTVIAIDRSFSMRYSDHMQRARAAALSIVNSLPARTPAEILALDSHVERLTEPVVEQETLRNAIASLNSSDLSSSYAELVRSLHSTEQNSNSSLDVHLISDMQQSAMPAAFTDLQLGPNVTITFHPVEDKKAPDFAVENVTSSSRVYDPKQTRASAIIAGWQNDSAVRKASLVIDGQTVETKNVTVPANGRAQVEFAGFNVGYGSHRCEIRIEPHDGLPADDAFSFPVERSEAATVLFIGKERPRESFYFKAAMESAENTGLKVQTINAQQAGGEDFSRYAFVVLSDLGHIDDSVQRKLDDFVRRGGSALVLLGPEAARTGRAPLTSLHLKNDTTTQGAAFVDNGHPALSEAGVLQNVQFFDTVRIDVPQGARVLAKLADGWPLFIEQNAGEGRVLTFASTFDNLANDFPIHKSFLPFVAQTGRYLADLDETASTVVAGTPVELRRSRQGGAAADVLGPDGHHELTLRQAATATDFVPQREGFYEVHRANGQRTLIAVHADRRESDLTPVPAETLTLWRNTGTAGVSASDGQSQLREQREPFWRFFLILLLGTALVESIFGSKYLKEERSQHERARATERVFAKT